MLSTNVLAWIGIATTLLVTVGQWVDPANIKTPWAWSPTLRVSLFVVLAAVTAFLKSFTDAPGTPWMQTLFVAGTTLVGALVAHFAHAGVAPKPEALASLGYKRGFTSFRAMLVVVLGFGGFLVALPACSGFWTEARKGAAEDFGACVTIESAALVVEGELTPEQEAIVAVKCASDPKTVHAFLVGHHEALATAQRAIRKAAADRAAGACLR
jgi:hypothetical protein